MPLGRVVISVARSESVSPAALWGQGLCALGCYHGVSPNANVSFDRGHVGGVALLVVLRSWVPIVLSIADLARCPFAMLMIELLAAMESVKIVGPKCLCGPIGPHRFRALSICFGGSLAQVCQLPRV